MLNINDFQELQDQAFNANLTMVVTKRSPILGYNHNIRHRGVVFHIQTEDSGVANPHIFTHLFHGGVILTSRKCEYEAEAAEGSVKALMQGQHKAVLRDLLRGRFREKINSYLGNNPELLPEKHAPGASEQAEGSVPSHSPLAQNPPVPATTEARTYAAVPAQQEEPLKAPILPPTVDAPIVPAVSPNPGHSEPIPAPVLATPRAAQAQPSSLTNDDFRTAAASLPESNVVVQTPTGRQRSRRPRRPTPRASSTVIVSAPPRVIGAKPSREKPLDDVLFGRDVISEKSLDEVILAYLSDDSRDD